MKKNNKNKGFTLVELIVVLVILAILAAILVPALLGYIDNARNKQTVLNARSAMIAAQAEMSSLYGSKSGLPDDIDDASKNYVTNIKNTADLTNLGCSIFKFSCEEDFPSGKTAADKKNYHKAFTVKYVEYKDDTGYVYFDGETWAEITTAPTLPNTTFTVLPAATTSTP